MDGKLADLSCREFSNQLASKAPVPGGGGVAALVGALGAALCSMTGNLTVGKKKYAQYEEDLQRMIVEAQECCGRLLGLIDRDADMFGPLQQAYSIPKDQPNRAETLHRVSIDACQAPLDMMKEICRAIELLEEMRAKGSVLMQSDVGCGALCCMSALECASMNIYINTKSLTGEDARDLEAQADTMLKNYLPRARAVADAVMKDIRG